MRLLLAEDDAALRYAILTLLQKNNYNVDAVDNGADALEYLRIGEYEGAILDIMMPRFSDSTTGFAKIEGNILTFDPDAAVGSQLKIGIKQSGGVLKTLRIEKKSENTYTFLYEG